MAESEKPVTDVVQGYLKDARGAHTRGDKTAALDMLEQARKADPDGKIIGVGLLQAELLGELGRWEAAEAALVAAETAHAKNFQPPFWRADLARKRGDNAAALEHLQRARANDEEGRAMLDLLEADVQRDLGDTKAARAILLALVERDPKSIGGHQKLALIAEDRKEFAEAREHFEAMVKLDPERLPFQMGLVRQLLALNAFDAAFARLENLRKRIGPNPQVMMALVRACRLAKLEGKELAALRGMLGAHPRDPQFLRHVFATRAKDGAPEVMEGVLDLVRRRQGTDLADDLEVKMGLQTMQFEGALRALRASRRGRRSPAEAQSLITALFGTYQYRLGLRYLRACLHRWPDNPGFLGPYVHYGPRFGQIAEVAAKLESMADRLPRGALLGHQMSLCGYQGNLEGAIKAYVGLKNLGLARPAQRWLLHKMVFSLADPTEAEEIYAKIGHPNEIEERGLLRIGLPGLMAMEFELERKGFELEPGMKPAALRDWVKARPGSPVPAIRLINASKLTPQSADDAVPRHIYQYWDAATPPDAVVPMIQSWASAPGFDHLCYDSVAARKFLRETFEKNWLLAFNLARDAAQQADFLRLCVLAEHGGVWADADDYLYGDLEKVLAAGRGLLVYQEPETGAIGNNFFAAPPKHPVVVFAARLACQALLQRASESAWLKTGPGVLTRAVGQYLISTDTTEAAQNITFLDWPLVAGEVAMHNPLRYKSAKSYWNQRYDRGEEDPSVFWEELLAALSAVK